MWDIRLWFRDLGFIGFRGLGDFSEGFILFSIGLVFNYQLGVSMRALMEVGRKGV